MDRFLAQCENVNMAPVKKNLQALGPHFLKEWREYAQLDQEEAAARLNVSRTLLSKIEGRKSPYSQRILEAAAEIYKCKPAELLIRNPNDPECFWPLFVQASKLEGGERRRMRETIEINLRHAAVG